MKLRESSNLLSHVNNLLSKLPTLILVNYSAYFIGLLFLKLVTDNSLICISVEMALVTLFYYFFHRFMFHNIPLNPHLTVHHEKQFNISRYLELTIDFTSETLILGAILLSVQVFTPSVVILLLLFFGITHLFIYSILGSATHKKHHEDPTKNFGPDFLDHLFGTNAGPEYEDILQNIPCLVQACIITHFAKGYFQWKD